MQVLNMEVMKRLTASAEKVYELSTSKESFWNIHITFICSHMYKRDFGQLHLFTVNYGLQRQLGGKDFQLYALGLFLTIFPKVNFLCEKFFLLGMVGRIP